MSSQPSVWDVRRTALRLPTLIQPTLADWAMVVVPDGGTGELVVLGEADQAGMIVGRAAVDGLPLGRVLRTGHTEQIEGTELSGLVPFPRSMSRRSS